MAKNLRKEALDSTAWGMLDRGCGIVVQFSVGVILARLLPPADFGLLGLGMILIGFGSIFVNLGLGPALIYKKDLTERHVRVVFTTSVLSGILLATLVYFGAPITQDIFNVAEVGPIIQSLSIIFLIAGFQIPSQSLLKKDLNFKQLFYANISSIILYGIITITMAMKGYGVWSLVIGTIIQRFVNLCCNYWFVRHSLLPLFSKREFLDLAHFGGGMTLSSIFNYFGLQGDNLMIGRILGVQSLGLYTRAYSLMQIPTQNFVSVLSNVLFPTAAKIQDEDERFQKLFLKSMRLIAFLVLPICTLLVIIAPQLIVGLYGKNWYGAIIPFQILGLFGVFRGMYSASAAFLYAKGFVYQILLAQVIYGIAMVVSVWLASTLFGLPGAALAAGISITIMWIVLLEQNILLNSIYRSDAYKTLYPGIMISILAGVPSLLARILFESIIGNIWIILLLVAFIFSFCVLVILLWIPQRYFFNLPHEIIKIVQQYIPINKIPFFKIFIHRIK